MIDIHLKARNNEKKLWFFFSQILNTGSIFESIRHKHIYWWRGYSWIRPLLLTFTQNQWHSGPESLSLSILLIRSHGPLPRRGVLTLTEWFTLHFQHVLNTYSSGDEHKLTWCYVMKRISTRELKRCIDWSKSSCWVSIAVISSSYFFMFWSLISCFYWMFYHWLSHAKLINIFFLTEVKDSTSSLHWNGIEI